MVVLSPTDVPIIQQMTPARRVDNRLLYQSPSSRMAITGDARTVKAQVLELLHEIEADVARRGSQASLGIPARLEFFREPRGNQGLAIFDGRNNLIVHVVEALLGSEDDGAKLCVSIMEQLGVPPKMIEETLRDVHPTQTYYLMLTRLRSSDVNGVPVAGGTTEVDSEWRSRRVR
jgi:hypothetical protein